VSREYNVGVKAFGGFRTNPRGLLVEADKWIERYIPGCEGAIGENPSVVVAQAMDSPD
jgi:hypothetical protein